jgi:hypothetical protein
MTAEPCQRRTHARHGNAFWVVRGGSAPARPFAVFLADGREAMALFSSDDEARVFCQFGEEGTDVRVRETSTREVLSLQFCPWCAKHVVVGIGVEAGQWTYCRRCDGKEPSEGLLGVYSPPLKGARFMYCG